MKYFLTIILLTALSIYSCSEEKKELTVTIDPPAEEGPFQSSLEVELTPSIDTATIYYTLDGSQPDENANIYQDILTIETTTTLMFYAIAHVKSEDTLPGFGEEGETLESEIYKEEYVITSSSDIGSGISIPGSSNTINDNNNANENSNSNSNSTVEIAADEQCRNDSKYWYNDTCNTSPMSCSLNEGWILATGGESCRSITITEAANITACHAINKYWYDDTCNESAIVCELNSGLKILDEETCQAITVAEAVNETACHAINKYWYDSTCNSSTITCDFNSWKSPKDDENCRSHTKVDADLTAATFSDSNHLELINSDTAISLKSTASNVYASCPKTGGTSNSTGLGGTFSGSNINSWFVTYKPTSADFVLHKITPRLKCQNGCAGASGNVQIEIRNDDGSGKPGDTIYATSDPVSATSMVSLSGAYVTFTFSTYPTLTQSTDYTILLIGADNFVSDSSNAVGWLAEDSCTSPTNQGDLGDLKIHYGTNSAWALSAGKTGVIKIEGETYNANATATLTMDAGGADYDWLFSTFAITELPTNHTNLLNYDFGVSDSATPSYSQTGVSKTDIQSTAPAEGRYFHLKMNFSSGSESGVDTTVSDISIRKVDSL